MKTKKAIFRAELEYYLLLAAQNNTKHGFIDREAQFRATKIISRYQSLSVQFYETCIR